MAVLATLAALFVTLNNAQTDFATQLADLQAKKALWLSNGVTDYVYQQSDNCFCFGCGLVGKYIGINGKSSTSDGTVSYVEIDSQDQFLINNPSLTCEVEEPLVDNYYNIENYFNIAIQFVQERVDAGCDSGTPSGGLNAPDCDGSVSVTYDDTLNYPTSILIQFNACGLACDAFYGYGIGCLTVLNEDVVIPSTYTNTCDDFTLPTPTGGACPSRCEGGFDGCNGCGCDGFGNPTFCTLRACTIEELGPAACGSCEVGYRLNTFTNTCDSAKVSCTRQNQCDRGFKCRKDPECREYSDLACPNTGKVCVTRRALETECTSNNDCDTANGYGCLDGDNGAGRCVRYQSPP